MNHLRLRKWGTVWCNQIGTVLTDTFNEPTAYEQHDYTNSEQIINFARHEYEGVGLFRIKVRSLVQKL